MNVKSDKTPEMTNVVSDDFIVSATKLVSKTANLYSAKIGVYVLMIGLFQFLFGLVADLLFFSSPPFIRPFYTATMGTDLFSFLTASLNLIGFSNSLIIWNLAFYSIGAVVFAIFRGGVVKYTLDIYRNTSKDGARRSLFFAGNRAGTLIAIQLIIGSLILLIESPVLLALIDGRILLYPIRPYSYLNAIINYLPLLLICLSGVVYVSVRFAPAAAVAVSEDLNTTDSLRRAWKLTSGESIHTLKGIFLLMVILGSLTGLLSFLALMLLAGFTVWMTLLPAAINQLFLSPIFCVFEAALYMNLLARKQSKAKEWWNQPAGGMNERDSSGSTYDTR